MAMTAVVVMMMLLVMIVTMIKAQIAVVVVVVVVVAAAAAAAAVVAVVAVARAAAATAAVAVVPVPVTGHVVAGLAFPSEALTGGGTPRLYPLHLRCETEEMLGVGGGPKQFAPRRRKEKRTVGSASDVACHN